MAYWNIVGLINWIYYKDSIEDIVVVEYNSDYEYDFSEQLKKYNENVYLSLCKDKIIIVFVKDKDKLEFINYLKYYVPHRKED